MNTKLQELTDKIYTEGLEKGKKEAERIIQEAQKQADQIIKEAQIKATEIEKNAQQEASDFEKKSKSEISLYAQQAINALQSEITNLITEKIVRESVSDAFKEKNFLSQIILSVSKGITCKDIITLQVADKEALWDFFKTKTTENLNNLKIEQVNGLKNSFTIVSEKEGYKIHVGEEDFITYFKQFIRPKMIEFLFDKE